MKTMIKSTRSVAITVTLMLAVVLSACYTNPLTKRKQLMLITPQEEASLGLTSFNQIKSETPISTDASQNALVQRVGQRISSVVDLAYAQWEFVMFREDQTLNAFCLPGGKVGVYSGILTVTQNEAGLATVVGHEVAHAVARHGGERMSQSLMVELGGMGLQAALQSKPAKTQELAMTAYGVGAVVGYELPFSRKQEYEADRMGLIYMAKAGYDPREAIAFWQRFKAWSDSQGSSNIEFLSTHPLDSKRIKQLEKYLPEALAVYQGR
jgi:metalloendopeptidase OMA1, mitochondrial